MFKFIRLMYFFNFITSKLRLRKQKKFYDYKNDKEQQQKDFNFGFILIVVLFVLFNTSVMHTLLSALVVFLSTAILYVFVKFWSFLTDRL